MFLSAMPLPISSLLLLPIVGLLIFVTVQYFKRPTSERKLFVTAAIAGLWVAVVLLVTWIIL